MPILTILDTLPSDLLRDLIGYPVCASVFFVLGAWWQSRPR